MGVKYKPVAAAPTTPSPSPALRRFLYFTAFMTGAAIMIVEILGAKMLAPYVGTSHFVWTAQIAVTLVALACGYFVGGWLVDRSQSLGRLYGAILLAAIYLCFSVLAVRPVAYWCLDFKLALGSLLASAFLFFVPLSLLAMVGPFFVRVLTVSVTGVGGNVGRLTALGTIGSFIGTILIGYVLIPFFPNSYTMFFTALLLMLVAAGYFFIWGKSSDQKIGTALGVGAGLILGAMGVANNLHEHPAGLVERFRGNSNFGLLQVMDTESGSRRYYLNDFLTQNLYDPAQKKSVALFTYMLHGLSRAYTKKIDSALCIGMGMGIVPADLVREGVKVDLVEINPAVVAVAEKYFDFNPEGCRLVIGDGRQFVNRATNKYDAILLDAFLGDSSPSHLMTREAFDSMRQLLRPGGVLVINSFVDFRTGHDFFGASLAKTLQSVFKSVRIHAAARDDLANVFFVASDQPELKLITPFDMTRVHGDTRERAEYTLETIIEPDARHGRILTDDFNPVEFHDAPNREATRRRLAEQMRPL